MHDALPRDSAVNNRYRIVNTLGQGGSGITYVAEDLVNGDYVALKELSLRGVSDWKKLDLFKREAQVLANLNHPAIPRYLDYFEIDTDSDRYFYIVQELVGGQSLAELVAMGQRFSESEIRRIASAILQVLHYLHRLNPPILHRDIKPQNIIRRRDGHIFLVDFGAVQAVQTTTIGSTVVGTFGYMAPEQFRGQAVPATDLYGLGATLIYLFTHQHPGELPQHRLKIDFRQVVHLSPPVANWLDKLLEPLLEERFDSAATALSALNNLAIAPQRLSQRDRIPKNGLSPRLPKQIWRSAIFAAYWNGLLLTVTVSLIAAGTPAFLGLALIPFWIWGLRLGHRSLAEIRDRRRSLQ